MSFGCEIINGKPSRFGFSSVRDWFGSVVLSFPAPWALKPREGKFYGTEIEDARGVCILRVWLMAGGPSHREKARFGEWSEDAWADYCCDSHWESVGSLALAESIVALRNEFARNEWADESINHHLVDLILKHGSWDEDCWNEIACGGPNKRALKSTSV